MNSIKFIEYISEFFWENDHIPSKNSLLLLNRFPFIASQGHADKIARDPFVIGLYMYMIINSLVGRC